VPRLLQDQESGYRERLDVGSVCGVLGELGESMAEGENGEVAVGLDLQAKRREIFLDSVHGEELLHHLVISRKLCIVEAALKVGGERGKRV
jgi:hypothetical protein